MQCRGKRKELGRYLRQRYCSLEPEGIKHMTDDSKTTRSASVMVYPDQKIAELLQENKRLRGLVQHFADQAGTGPAELMERHGV